MKLTEFNDTLMTAIKYSQRGPVIYIKVMYRDYYIKNMYLFPIIFLRYIHLKLVNSFFHGNNVSPIKQFKQENNLENVIMMKKFEKIKYNNNII